MQFDLTYRCNERCIHCYLDHDDHGELTTAEVARCRPARGRRHAVPGFSAWQGAAAVARPVRDFGYACRLGFDVKLKTNGSCCGRPRPSGFATTGSAKCSCSVYSHRPDVHDAITKVPGPLARTIDAVAAARARPARVLIANALMQGNAFDYQGESARRRARRRIDCRPRRSPR